MDQFNKNPNKKEIIFEMTDGDPIVFNEKDVLKF